MATAKKSAAKKVAKKAAAKRMGRPPRAGADGAATRVLLMRLTEAEYAKIEAAAERAGEPVAAFARAALLSITKIA